MQITTLPVYSKLADAAAIPAEVAERLPDGWQLSEHQLETYKALIDTNVDVVINTAMTGDGKSLAGLLPLLVRNRHTLTLYPTNELLRDQFVSAGHTLPAWDKQRSAEHIGMLFGARLDELAEEAEYGQRGNHVAAELMSHQLVLSNPDIFHAILQFSYQHGRAPEWLSGQLIQQFSQLTFDEFHIFDAPQVAAVLTGLLYLYEQKGSLPLKTLFLSATPGDVLLPLLDKAGFSGRIRMIAGEYLHDSSADPQHWRQILQPVTISFSDQKIVDWLDAHLEDRLLAFFRAHGKGAKGAIIVNSVAMAHHLLDILQPRLAQFHLTVLPNTGLTGRATKADSRNADLLIGTSTVDVGVDFQINFLLFESSDAGNFIQRLGRLGRHKEYRDAHSGMHAFNTFEAHALLPSFVYQRLTQGYKELPAQVADGQTLRRDELNDIVRSVFPNPTRYDRYLAHWGRFQPMRVVYELKRGLVGATYAELVQRLVRRYQNVFSASMQGAINAAAAMTKEGRKLLVEEARSLRGSSPFTCGVFLPDEPEPLRYDLLWLLANAELMPLTKETFCAEVQRRGYGRTAFERDGVVAFFQVNRLKPERADVQVNLQRGRIDWSVAARGQAQVIEGVQVDCAVPWDLNGLNRHLVQRHFAATLVPSYHPLKLQNELFLPTLFPLYSYVGGDSQGTIAFGRQALILDTLLRYRKLRYDSNDAIIC